MKATPPSTLPADAPPPTEGVAENLVVSPTPVVPKKARWPEWFTGLDIVLGIIAVLLAFLMASFAARNSDVWLHLASGRLIASGELYLGADPLSLAAERPWVHPTWLTDVVAFLLYEIDATGTILVAVKAALFAAAFLFMSFLRRPGYSVMPWAVVGIVGILAAAPYAQLRPTLISFVMFAFTFMLIDRLDWTKSRWSSPVKVAGTFALWANMDGWFFLGPLMIASLLVGEFLNRYIVGKSVTEDSGPFTTRVPVPMLAKTLLLGCVVCLLNPFFLAALVKDPTEAVAQLLPIELGFGMPAGASTDANLATLTLTPLSPIYLDSSYHGNSVNGLAFAALLVLGIVMLIAQAFVTFVNGQAKFQSSFVVLWVVFGALAFQQIRFIAIFALVSVPLIASHWNGLAEFIRLGRSTSANDRVILTLSGFARVILVILGFAALLLTYPGWLHPQFPRSTQQTRLDWGIAPDAGLERSAKILADLRESNQLQPDITGLNVSMEFGNYCAWYAPKERSFVNGRFAFHRHELDDLLTLGQIVPVRITAETNVGQTIDDIARVLKERNASYLSVASARSPDLQVVFNLWFRDNEYVLWHLDGRFVMIGRFGDDATQNETVKKLKFDPVKLAMNPNLKPLPEGKALPPLLPKVDYLDQYLDRPLPIPAEIDDAQVYARYEEILTKRGEIIAQEQEERTRFARGVFGAASQVVIPIVKDFEDDLLALPILQLRAARQALAANPDTLEGWQSLVQAYSSPFAPVATQEETSLQLLTARVQLLDRLPSPKQINPMQSPFAMKLCEQLFEGYQQNQQSDLAKKYFDLYEEFFNALPAELKKRVAQERFSQNRGVKDADAALKLLTDAIEQQQDALRRETQRKNDFIDRQPTQQAKFENAVQYGMPLRASKVANETPDTELARWPQQLKVLRIQLELQAGRIDQVSASLDASKEQLEKLYVDRPNDAMTNALRQLQSLRYRLEGNYTEATKTLIRPSFPAVTFDPTLNKLPQIFGGMFILGGSTFSSFLTNDQQHLQGIAGVPLMQYVTKLSTNREILLAESSYSYDRALLSVVDGKIDEAKVWFTNAKSPQNVDLNQLGDSRRLFRIERYLAMIERAKSTSQQP